MLLIELAGNRDILDLHFSEISDIEMTSIPERAETLSNMSDQDCREFLTKQGLSFPVEYTPLMDLIVGLTRHNPETRMSIKETARLLASMNYES